MRSQFATSKTISASSGKTIKDTRGGRRSRPLVFTEHGAIMAASVLNSKKAVEMSILVVRAFIHFRQALATNEKIVTAIKSLERRVTDHDASLEEIVDVLLELLQPPPASTRKIGFLTPPSNV